MTKKTILKEATATHENKTLKSLTLPTSIANKLKQLSKKTGCTQADIVKVAISEILELNDEELTKLLIEHQIC